jgi:hypothetical protein
MRQVLFYTAVLVGGYLALSHATEGGKLLTAGRDFYTGAVRTLQGR